MNKKFVNEMLNIATDNIEAITEPKDKVMAISAFLTMINEIIPGGVASLEDGDDEEEAEEEVEEQETKKALKKESSKKNSKANEQKDAKSKSKAAQKQSKEEVAEEESEEVEEAEIQNIFIVDGADVSIAEEYESNEFAVWLIEAIEYYGLEAVEEELAVFTSNVVCSIAELEEEGLEAFVSHLSSRIDEEEGEE